MQRLLAGNAELSQKPPYRHRAQDDTELVLDQLRTSRVSTAQTRTSIAEGSSLSPCRKPTAEHTIRAHAHLFQRLMIQLSRVVFSHAGRESISIHAVKQNIELLMNGLIGESVDFPVEIVPITFCVVLSASWPIPGSNVLAAFSSNCFFQARVRITPNEHLNLPNAGLVCVGWSAIKIIIETIMYR